MFAIRRYTTVNDKSSINASLFHMTLGINGLHNVRMTTRFVGRWSLLRHGDKGTSCERFPTLKSRCCPPALSAQIKHYVWHRTRRLSPSQPGKISPPLSAIRGIVKSIELIRSQTSAKLRPIICADFKRYSCGHYGGVWGIIKTSLQEYW